MGAVKQLVIENQDLKQHIQNQGHYITYLTTFIADIRTGYISGASDRPLTFDDFVANVLTPNNTEVEEVWLN